MLVGILPLPQGTFGNVWRHFWLTGDSTGIVVARDVNKLPATQRKALPLPPTRNYLVENVNNVEAEKSSPWSRTMDSAFSGFE